MGVIKGITKGFALVSAAIIAFAIGLFLAANLALITPVAAVHDTQVTISPGMVACGSIPQVYVVTINNTNSVTIPASDSIREVRVYNDVDGDGNADAGILSFVCGAPPIGWTLTDRLSDLNYCEYVTTVQNSNRIFPGGSKTFTFNATLDSLNVQCGNAFRISTIDNATPTGQLQFKSPMVLVDCSAPVSNKILTDPKKVDSNVEWIDGISSIVLSSVDELQACTEFGGPSGVNKTYYRVLALDDSYCLQGDPINTTTGAGNCDLDDVETNVQFTEYTGAIGNINESCHGIQYYSVDKLGNAEEVRSNCFFVDKTPPEISKTVGDPSVQVEDLEDVGDGDASWTTENGVTSGINSAKLDISGTPWPVDFAGVDSFFDVFVELDDINSLTYDAKVTQGDPAWQPLVVLGVDADGDGLFEAQPLEWEASSNGIPDNNDPNLLGDDTFIQCEHPTGDIPIELIPLTLTGVDVYNGFMCYTPKADGTGYEPVYQPLSHYQLNDVGRVETDDDVAMLKVMLGGNPATQDNEIAYVDNVKLNGVVVIDEPSYYITSDTHVTLSCVDQQPHPSGGEMIFWKYRFTDDGIIWEDGVETGCDSVVDGFCKVNDQVVDITFPESSLHELTWFCKDAVAKVSKTDVEYFRVDNDPPIIEKDMFGYYLGDCPAGTDITHGNCYVSDNGQSGVDVSVQDKPSIHAVGGAYCSYSVQWHTSVENCDLAGGVSYDAQTGRCLIDFGDVDPTAHITFSEDSTHDLELYCYDALGNAIDPIPHVETFLVDSTPPVTNKAYGNPIFTCSEWCEELCEYHYEDYAPYYDGEYECVEACIYGQLQVGIDDVPIYEQTCGGYDVGGHLMPVWISTNTSVTLTATDAKVGVDGTFWRNTLLQSEYPCRDAKICDLQEGSGPWNTYSTPFFKPEESCHLIEYWSNDSLTNTETIKKQCVFVDPRAPVTNKTIGDPKLVVGGDIICTNTTVNNSGGGGGGSPVITNTTGKYVSTINFSQKCGSGIGVGIAFDGKDLWYSCYNSNPDLFKANAVTGQIIESYNIASGIGALAYDATRNGLWVGFGSSPRHIRFSQFNSTKNIINTTIVFTPAIGGLTLDDGLAFDAQDDTLYISPDVDVTVYHYMTNGSFINSFPKAASSCGMSGIAVGGQLLYEGFNGCNEVKVVNKNNTGVIVFNFSTQQSGDPAFRDEDLECDTVTFAAQGKHVMWSVEAYDSNFASGERRALAFEIPFGSCGIGGQSTDIVCTSTNQTVYVNNQTPIWLSCNDGGPHPVDHASLSWRTRFADDCDDLGDASWGQWVQTNRAYTHFNFNEDSCHELEYFCVDALGNEEQHQFEIDVVDSQPPEITKTIVGPHIGQCPPQNEDDICYIDGVTEIHVSVVDPEPHPVNDVSCRWAYRLDDDELIFGGQGLGGNFIVHFPEESKHDLHIECQDALGNRVVDDETFYVDKTPPTTRKSYGDPLYVNETGEWINSTTPITLTVYDSGPHKTGINETKYRVTRVSDTYCNALDYQLDCDDATGNGSFKLYSVPFTIGEESCHLIEYYSVDNVNKTEETHRQCAFVDTTAPIPNKTVGEPKSKLPANYTFNFYPEVNGHCWADPGLDPLSIDCWKVTTLTPITLDCADPQPHPVDNSKIHFNVSLDGEDATQAYCDEVGGEMVDGYCLVDEQDAPVTFYFNETSEHNLAYYCTDALGNKGPIDDEKFKVEETAFNITINKKWNLISVPFVLLDESMHAVFDGNPDIASVWTYDPTHATCATDWCMFTPDGNNANDFIDSMVPGQGYWVLAKNDTSILIGGSLFSPAITPPDKEIVAGWNLIGYYGNQDENGDPVYSYDGPVSFDPPVGAGKTSVCMLGTLVDTTIGYPKWASLYTYWELFNTDGDPTTSTWVPLGFFDQMDAGAGYWLEIDVPESYSPSTTCPLII